MIDKLDQLRDFAAWEHEYDPAPDGKMHIAAWAIAEIEQLRAKLEWMPDGPDGIDCRNETIKLQDENVARLRGGQPLMRINESTDAERYQFLVQNCGYEITKNGRGKLVLPERVTAPDYLGKLSAAIDSTLMEDRANEAD